MRILRPAQVQLLAAGLPATPANKSSDSTSRSDTTNQYADKRNAVQGGVGQSGDGNSSSYFSVSTDGGSVAAAMQAMIAAITGNTSVATNANSSMGAVANTAITSTADASKHLEDVGLAMLQANTALTNSLTGAAMNSAGQTTQIAADLAKTQVAAQNDNRYLIAAGLAVVAIVGVTAFGHKG
ncbi:hypothetical protein [Paraburkholderia rhynchosiae]|uniref:Uncharacterized protein n=1 Tax=Paraburkholderia rhynchosiae TaxID=487049 RepID=A0A2N7VU27_9BURK|nr:hypothetical protein [Paraburkholderia rhynchosiae]PMS20664.1 hypothetical protein C0Z16_34340 [Paraburkholderia rhynchosiae]CAB3726200.1 hypothetical protein LMG27174_05389 [Paraburkholderia rhynchosiae]